MCSTVCQGFQTTRCISPSIHFVNEFEQTFAALLSLTIYHLRCCSRMSPLQVQTKKRPTLAKRFKCPFCANEDTVECKMDFRVGVGRLGCRLCGASYQMPIHHLHEPIDVFSEWLDDCEAAAQGKRTGGGGGGGSTSIGGRGTSNLPDSHGTSSAVPQYESDDDEDDEDHVPAPSGLGKAKNNKSSKATGSKNAPAQKEQQQLQQQRRSNIDLGLGDSDDDDGDDSD